MKLGFLTLGLSFVKKHKRLLITGASVVSTTAAVFFALKDGPECARILEELNAQGATTLEKAKAVGPNMLKVAVCWAMSIGLQIFGHKTASDTINDLTASLTNAYLISKIHDEDRQKAIESVVGKDKAKEIDDEMARNGARRSYGGNPDDITVASGSDAGHPFITGHGNQLYYDADLGFWFRANENWIDKNHVKLSTRVLQDGEGYASENDYRDMMNIPPNRFDGEHRVWIDNEIMKYGCIEADYVSASIVNDEDNAERQESYIIIKHTPKPRLLSEEELTFGYPGVFR